MLNTNVLSNVILSKFMNFPSNVCFWKGKALNKQVGYQLYTLYVLLISATLFDWDGTP